ncbi:uncharacterized protein I303_101807 [Kwoniella dejecticola CBS 10117]|uniref:glucan 1,3-beta-glucosidase n=1 Tax=Kwoniella dejecticola CBS 10117 TaxID=1296121 RepID=A0A1A6ACR0_9TREE|nr:uncharacterized protein I303_02058 [Kwoniella dejecticola CBS 10117]OBR87844.1 hypothetical protein I303_02058 [Kwoniella dejecticola CBS 10117]
MWTRYGLLVLPSVLGLVSARLGSTSLAGGNLSRRDINPDGVIRGVNLGGWLLTEEWITPSLYTNDAADEWHLCAELGKKKCLSVLESHWRSFFTRDDFEEIKSAGLNSVRIPIGYWAVDVLEAEPYVSGQYPYLIQAVNWATELGLSVLLDLHGAPGSQNGQDNSGLIGVTSFYSNTSNIDRTLNVLKNLTEEFTQDIYGGTVIGIELLNEPRLSDTFTMADLKSFYSQASETIRGVNGNINITMHDAFWGPQYWANYNPLPNSTQSTALLDYTIDTHQYYAFEPLNNLPHDVILEKVCNVSKILKSTNQGILPTIVGEWSLETGHSPNSSSSGLQNKDDSQAKRTWFRLFFESQLAAYQPSASGQGQPSIGWYYWTWKTDYDIDTWSYRRGLAQGYIPSDVSNSSTLVFPILDNGCVDSTFNYTAPRNPGSSGVRLLPASCWETGIFALFFSFVVCIS